MTVKAQQDTLWEWRATETPELPSGDQALPSCWCQWLWDPEKAGWGGGGAYQMNKGRAGVGVSRVDW